MGEALPTSPDDPRLDGWYHTIELGEGIVSRGYYDHRPVVDRFGIPESLAGKTALDVGTADGFFAFELERRGAERVVAVDLPDLGSCDWLPRMRARLPQEVLADASWPGRFRTAHAMRGSAVEYRQLSVYDLSPEALGSFDVVFCGSLLLHLQNPLAALCAVRSVSAGIAIVETALDREAEEALPDSPRMWFGALDEERRAGNELGQLNSYWLFTTRALVDMLLYADFAAAEPHGTFELPPHGLPVTSVIGRV